MTTFEKGKNAEKLAASRMIARGFKTVLWPFHHVPWDFCVDGWLIEVKCSTLSERTDTWGFNIHRHGKMSDVPLTAYIFVLKGVPFSNGEDIYLVVPPVEIGTSKVVKISLRSLRERWANWVDKWEVVTSSPKLIDPFTQEELSSYIASTCPRAKWVWEK